VDVRRVLHLVRDGAVPALVAEPDWVVYLPPGAPPQLAVRGEPPIPAGPIDHDQLVALLAAADLVVTW
jgi:hypothetical protein